MYVCQACFLNLQLLYIFLFSSPNPWGTASPRLPRCERGAKTLTKKHPRSLISFRLMVHSGAGRVVSGRVKPKEEVAFVPRIQGCGGFSHSVSVRFTGQINNSVWRCSLVFFLELWCSSADVSDSLCQILQPSANHIYHIPMHARTSRERVPLGRFQRPTFIYHAGGEMTESVLGKRVGVDIPHIGTHLSCMRCLEYSMTSRTEGSLLATSLPDICGELEYVRAVLPIHIQDNCFFVPCGGIYNLSLFHLYFPAFSSTYYLHVLPRVERKKNNITHHHSFGLQ